MRDVRIWASSYIDIFLFIYSHAQTSDHCLKRRKLFHQLLDHHSCKKPRREREREKKEKKSRLSRSSSSKQWLAHACLFLDSQSHSRAKILDTRQQTAWTFWQILHKLSSHYIFRKKKSINHPDCSLKILWIQ